MNKFLVLNFENAGLFRKHKNTKDKAFELDGGTDRKDLLEFVEPITVHQISNMLHVLFGERPKPVNRITVYDNVPYLYDKAHSSYLRIDSYKNEKGEFQSQTIQTRKAVWNAWSKVDCVYWDRIERFLGPELFETFADGLNEIFQMKVTDVTFIKLKEMVLNSNDDRVKTLIQSFRSKGKTPLYDFFYKTKLEERTTINRFPLTQLTVTSGLDKVIRLNGQILVPVNDDDIIKIKQNKGCATILDGGLVYIKGVKSIDLISIDDFTQVKDISLEKQ